MADDVDNALDLEEVRMEEKQNEIRKRREAERLALATISERECEECGAIIPLERLKIVPLAKLCISCQSELERHRR